MNTCIKKYFDKDITDEDVKNILKNMLFDSSLEELQDFKKSKEIPACMILYIQAIEQDLKRGSIDTVDSSLDYIFTNETGEEI